MKFTYYSIFCCVCILIIGCQSNHSTPTETTQPTTTITDDSWTTLSEQSSWRGYRKDSFPSEGWTVQNEVFTVTKGGGDLITIDTFENFELSLEFMVHTEGGNSGIFYKVIEDENLPIWANAPEFQVLDNEYHMQGVAPETYHKHLAGDLYDLYAGDGNYALPIGKWNSVNLIVDNNKVKHVLNDNTIVEFEIGSTDWNERINNSKFKDYPMFGQAKAGHIGLQDHNNQISFRNIKIKRL